VVEPTQLKNMLVKMGSSSPNRGENKKIFETTTHVRFLGCTFPFIQDGFFSRHPEFHIWKVRFGRRIRGTKKP